MPQTLVSPVSKHTLTYEEFLARDWENPHVEWIDGEVVEMSPVTELHSDEDTWLGSLFRLYADAHGGKCHRDPFQMKTGADLPSRAPDLMYVSVENLHRLHSLYLQGPADVAVEIISPGSGGVDRGDKFFEYERGGVKEYWLIDPQRKQAEFYRLGDDGMFHAVQMQDGIFRSDAMPGFWIEIAWLWPPTQPPILDVLRAWKLI